MRKLGGNISDLDLQTVLHALEKEKGSATSITGTKHMEAVLSKAWKRSKINQEEYEHIRRMVHKTEREIRDRRTQGPNREVLNEREMLSIIQLIGTDDTAYMFAVQALLTLRAQTVLAIAPEDVQIDETQRTFSILLRQEKVASEEGAPRTIKRIPFHIADIAPASAFWQPVVNSFIRDMRVNGPRWNSAKAGGYASYRLRLKDLLSSTINRFLSTEAMRGLATHCARRTGATLHMVEGWKANTIMAVGGWHDVAEFGKYLQGILTIADVQRAA